MLLNRALGQFWVVMIALVAQSGRDMAIRRCQSDGLNDVLRICIHAVRKEMV